MKNAPPGETGGARQSCGACKRLLQACCPERVERQPHGLALTSVKQLTPLILASTRQDQACSDRGDRQETDTQSANKCLRPS